MGKGSERDGEVTLWKSRRGCVKTKEGRKVQKKGNSDVGIKKMLELDINSESDIHLRLHQQHATPANLFRMTDTNENLCNKNNPSSPATI